MQKIRSVLFYTFIGILFLIGTGLFSLTNQGVLALRKPYARQLVENFQPNQGKVIIENVTVIPMNQEIILTNQSVLIQDGIIVQIDDLERVEVPSDSLRIDGEGKFLIPGLTDMHVHVKEENELILFAANGVTSIRNMWGGTGALRLFGFPDHLAWREKIENGELFGPTLLTSGPIMEGPPTTMPLMETYDSLETAAEAVIWQVAQGYDFIKVYDYLDLQTYNAVIEAARELKVDVVGHVPKPVGLEHALVSEQKTIEHLSGLIDPDSAEYLIPKDQLSAAAKRIKQAGTWVCPTIAVYQMHVPYVDLNVLENRSEMAYVSPGMKLTWQYFSRPGAMSSITYQGDYPARIHEIFISTATLLHQEGVRFILGTDSDNPYLVPGFSLLDELDYLIEAGFTPYEALEAGTRNPAESMGMLDEFGTIEVGKQADLVLLVDNPLLTMRNIRNRAGVMLQGQWYPEEQLQEMLQALAASYSPTLIERLWPLTLIGWAIYLIIRKEREKQVG